MTMIATTRMPREMNYQFRKLTLMTPKSQVFPHLQPQMRLVSVVQQIHVCPDFTFELVFSVSNLV